MWQRISFLKGTYSCFPLFVCVFEPRKWITSAVRLPGVSAHSTSFNMEGFRAGTCLLLKWILWRSVSDSNSISKRQVFSYSRHWLSFTTGLPECNYWLSLHHKTQLQFHRFDQTNTLDITAMWWRHGQVGWEWLGMADWSRLRWYQYKWQRSLLIWVSLSELWFYPSSSEWYFNSCCSFCRDSSLSLFREITGWIIVPEGHSNL